MSIFPSFVHSVSLSTVSSVRSEDSIGHSNSISYPTQLVALSLLSIIPDPDTQSSLSTLAFPPDWYTTRLSNIDLPHISSSLSISLYHHGVIHLSIHRTEIISIGFLFQLWIPTPRYPSRCIHYTSNRVFSHYLCMNRNESPSLFITRIIHLLKPLDSLPNCSLFLQIFSYNTENASYTPILCRLIS